MYVDIADMRSYFRPIATEERQRRPLGTDLFYGKLQSIAVVFID